MNYEVKYNQSGTREFANVTFENGHQVSYEIITSRIEDPTLRRCRGSLPEGMMARLDGYKLEIIELADENCEKLNGKFNHQAFGECEVVDENGQFTRIKVLETGEIKMLFTRILMNNIAK